VSYAADTIARARELSIEGFNDCAIERYTDIPRNEVRRILGRDDSRLEPKTNDDLSVRQRQQLLNGMTHSNTPSLHRMA